MSGFRELLDTNAQLQESIRKQLLVLRNKRSALLAQRQAIDLLLQEHDNKLSTWKSNAADLCDVLPESFSQSRGYDLARQIPLSSSSLLEGFRISCSMEGKILSLDNLHVVRHVLDPFSDAFRAPSRDDKCYPPNRLVQFVAPPNADEKAVAEIEALFPPPGNRIAWTKTLDSALTSLVSGATASPVPDSSNPLWAEVSLALQALSVRDLAYRIDDDALCTPVPISPGCCIARWYGVLLPLANYNASMIGKDGATEARLLDAVGYGSTNNHMWPASHDAYLEDEVIRNKGITGRSFWIELSNAPSLRSHSLFAILSRYQQILNPFHGFELANRGRRREWLAQLVSNIDIAIAHIPTGFSLSSSRAVADITPWSPAEMKIVAASAVASSDLSFQYALYLTACYSDARLTGLGAPFIMFQPQSMLLIREKEQIRSRIRCGVALSSAKTAFLDREKVEEGSKRRRRTEESVSSSL